MLSFLLTKVILVEAIPIKTLISDVKTNIPIIVINILPSLFGSFILPIEVLKVKNIKGTIIVSNKLINKVPKGFNIVAFSLKITPIKVPTITEINIIIVDL